MKELLYFSSPTCAPCKAFYPIVEAVAKEKGLDLFKLDREDNADIAISYRVMSVPTLVLLEDGVMVDSLSGLRPKSAVEKMLS